MDIKVGFPLILIIMPVRTDRLIESYFVMLMESIFGGVFSMNLPWFIMSTIEKCYKKITMGYGLQIAYLLLRFEFKFLEIFSLC